MADDAGQDLVEYALVLPIFLLLVLGVIEFGLLFFQYNVVANAAREGARAGIVMETDTCPTSCLAKRVDDAAREITAGLDPKSLTITPQWLYPAGSIPQVRVRVRYQTSLMTQTLIEAIGGSGKITLESTATMQREF
jgi:Flp pilus assembly protein TadG